MSVYAAGPPKSIALSIFPNGLLVGSVLLSIFPNGLLVGSVLFVLNLWLPGEMFLYLSHLFPSFKQNSLKGRVAFALAVIFSYAILAAFSACIRNEESIAIAVVMGSSQSAFKSPCHIYSGSSLPFFGPFYLRTLSKLALRNIKLSQQKGILMMHGIFGLAYFLIGSWLGKSAITFLERIHE